MNVVTSLFVAFLTPARPYVCVQTRSRCVRKYLLAFLCFNWSRLPTLLFDLVGTVTPKGKKKDDLVIGKM